MSSTPKSSTVASLAAAAAAAAALSCTAFVQTPGTAAKAGRAAGLRGQSGAAQQPFAAAPSNSSSATPLLGLGAAAGTAAILASQQRAKGTQAVKAAAVPRRAFENELGVQAPLGFWDPIGYTADGSAENFARRRQTELKHGRIAMLATMGYITPELTGKLPGYLSPSMNLEFQDVPNGLAAISKVPAAGWAQILAYMSFCEVSQDQSAGTPAAAGDFGFKVLTASDPAEKTKKLQAELANGRLAMMAIMGMFFQDGLTGSAWGDWALYTDSPLRAFENELGVQAPVGFFDPLGLCKDGDEDAFKRRRTTELKNGRVAMLACLGYIVPEFFRFPGYCSPSMNVQFADVPNGLAAIEKIPGEGWFQWIVFMGAIEKGLYPSETMRAPGDYPAGGVLGVPNGSTLPDGPTKTNKLNAELANGRLAMMAITGMWFQDGLTGSAWGDWSNYTDSPLRAFEGELGVQAPFGYWDPVGLSSDGDLATFKRRRETEIKHGRVAMWAAMGYIAPEYFRWPGLLSPSADLKFTDVPNGLAACSKVPGNGWAQVILFCGSVETYWGYNAYAKGGTPGDYGWKAITSTDPETRNRKLNAELANGRLAMMAVTGMFFQDGLTGSAWGDWALYTDSPLRAFENELGVQAPLGFWDPLGFTADGDMYSFKRRRSVEIKHGRICMLATMGYITPEVAGKFPGYLSPSSKLLFADVPNGLAAISKVPFLGWTQILAYCAFCEISADYDADVNERTPGDMGWNPPLFSGNDPETKKRRLNAEIANGRLAMMAIMGMFFQDGLTGSAWGDWALYTDSPLRAFENELGVQAPLGYWDPVGYSSDGDAALFRRRRETEIKHGRVAMFATMGYIVPEYVRFPGYLSPSANLKFTDMPAGLSALSKVPAVGLVQIFLFIGLVDFTYYRADPARDAGDFANGGILGVPNGTGPMKDADARKRKLNAELANGRLAMMAIIGMFFQDGLTGSAWGDWALYEGSPLRAFESELGVQAPVGFWDPLGFTSDGDASNFKRRRSVELKHGRISMMATMGYITPEVTGKLPGYLSPSAGLKFADIPNGLAAVSKVPSLGWAQIAAYFGFVEFSGGFEDYKSGTPGDYGFKVLTSSDPEEKTKKLSAEIANGRLAMMAIIGMFFQDGLTGSAWGDWALYTASPLRAFDATKEVGAVEPLGFWDPAGLADGKDEAWFKQMRGYELKHGRVAMMAIVGFLGQHFWRFPGCFDVPDGVAALKIMPASANFGCLFLVAGFFELRILGERETEPGNFGDPFKIIDNKLIGGYDEQWRNFELNNGRLAMVGAIGTIVANGYTGLDAFEQWQAAKPVFIQYLKTTLPYSP